METILLFFTGLAAGFIDAIAGGGGLITVPVLLWLGLPVPVALGTNKMQSTFGTAVAVSRYHRAGMIDWKNLRVVTIVTLISSVIGTIVVSQLSDDLLKKAVPWMLLAIAIYTLCSPSLGAAERAPKLSILAFSLLFGGVLGFYDGFFGPGTGSFWAIAWVTLMGVELTKATAATKVVNLASNIASLMTFVWLGHYRTDIALVMIAGQLVGARLGAGMAIKHGQKFIRIVFIAVVLALVVRLMWATPS
ncbi:MAG: TSUP family transporter [Verrucomicrobiaceae bacterium]|nr:TSUP family transporter [Verrucomicrobiaceae bacterium]